MVQLSEKIEYLGFVDKGDREIREAALNRYRQEFEFDEEKAQETVTRDFYTNVNPPTKGALMPLITKEILRFKDIPQDILDELKLNN